MSNLDHGASAFKVRPLDNPTLQGDPLMAARSRLVSVTTTATALNNLDELADSIAGSAATVYNDGAVTVYIGGADVATSGATKGIPLLAGETMNVEGQGDVLYGRVAASTCDVIVLEVGVAAA